MSSIKFDANKVKQLWTALAEAETRLREATQQLVSTPKSSTKQKWEVEYDSYSEASEAYANYMEDLADSIEISG